LSTREDGPYTSWADHGHLARELCIVCCFVASLPRWFVFRGYFIFGVSHVLTV
jgi:hypothetical protein